MVVFFFFGGGLGTCLFLLLLVFLLYVSTFTYLISFIGAALSIAFLSSSITNLRSLVSLLYIHNTYAGST